MATQVWVEEDSVLLPGGTVKVTVNITGSFFTKGSLREETFYFACPLFNMNESTILQTKKNATASILLGRMSGSKEIEVNKVAWSLRHGVDRGKRSVWGYRGRKKEEPIYIDVKPYVVEVADIQLDSGRNIRDGIYPGEWATITLRIKGGHKVLLNEGIQGIFPKSSLMGDTFEWIFDKGSSEAQARVWFSQTKRSSEADLRLVIQGMEKNGAWITNSQPMFKLIPPPTTSFANDPASPITIWIHEETPELPVALNGEAVWLYEIDDNYNAANALVRCDDPAVGLNHEVKWPTGQKNPTVTIPPCKVDNVVKSAKIKVLDAKHCSVKGRSEISLIVKDYPLLKFARGTDWCGKGDHANTCTFIDGTDDPNTTFTVTLEEAAPADVKAQIRCSVLTTNPFTFTIPQGETTFTTESVSLTKSGTEASDCVSIELQDDQQKARVDNSFRRLIYKDDPSIKPCPNQPTVQPCNMVRMTITETHNNNPAERGIDAREGIFRISPPGGDRTNAFLSTASTLRKDTLTLPAKMADHPFDAPIIHVIAGKEGDSKAQADFHQTTLAIALEMEEEGCTCGNCPKLTITKLANPNIDGDSEETVISDQKTTSPYSLEVFRDDQPWETQASALKDKTALAFFKHLLPDSSEVEGGLPTDSTKSNVRIYHIAATSCGIPKNVAAQGDKIETYVWVFPSDENKLALQTPTFKEKEETGGVLEGGGPSIEFSQEISGEQPLYDPTEDDTTYDGLQGRTRLRDAQVQSNWVKLFEEQPRNKSFSFELAPRFQQEEPDDLKSDLTDWLSEDAADWAKDAFAEEIAQAKLDAAATPKPDFREPLKSAESGLYLVRNTAGNFGERTAEIFKSFYQVLKAVWSIQEVWNQIQNLLPTVGWGMEFGIGVLEGKATWRWGWKEWTDFRAFYWQEVDLQITLVRINFKIYFGISQGFWLFKFQFVLYGLISLNVPYESWMQVEGPDRGSPPVAAPVPTQSPRYQSLTNAPPAISQNTTAPSLSSMGTNSSLGAMEIRKLSEGWFGAVTHAELGINLILVHENFMHANANVSSGYEFQFRVRVREPGMEYRTFFLGLSFNARISCIGFKSKEKTITFIDKDDRAFPRSEGSYPCPPAVHWEYIRNQFRKTRVDIQRKRKHINDAIRIFREAQKKMILTTKKVDQTTQNFVSPAAPMASEEELQNASDLPLFWMQAINCYNSQETKTFGIPYVNRDKLGAKLKNASNECDLQLSKIPATQDILRSVERDLDIALRNLSTAEQAQTNSGVDDIHQKAIRDQHMDNVKAIQDRIKVTGAKDKSRRLQSLVKDLLSLNANRSVTVHSG